MFGLHTEKKKNAAWDRTRMLIRPRQAVPNKREGTGLYNIQHSADSRKRSIRACEGEQWHSCLPLSLAQYCKA
jgi:hypothetical protein